MKLSKANCLRTLPRPLRERLRRHWTSDSVRTVILMYHRVIVLPSDPQRLSVSPANFRQHLEIIRRLAEPVSLAEAVSRRAEPRETAARPRVALTFDDGYADNAWFAAPLLRAREIPATIFVTTGAVDDDREFWWDELERHLLHPETLPPALEMVAGGQCMRWEIPEAQASDAEDWNVQYGSRSARQSAYLELLERLSSLTPAARDTALDSLAVWSGRGRLGRTSHRPLTREELLSLCDGELITLGAHTVSHPVLSQLPTGLQREQIETSRIWLQAVTGITPDAFAYPHGGSHHYTPATVRHVQRAGFAVACTTAGRPLGALDDTLEIPRQVVRDWEGPLFEDRLREWLGL